MTDESSNEEYGGLEKIEYWEPRVMRHREGEAGAWFAVHEVYLDGNGNMVRYTLDALSPAASSVDELRGKLQDLLKDEPIVSGERGYTYSTEDVEYWIELLDAPILEYERGGKRRSA